MKSAKIQSRCECQTKLSAVVQEDGIVSGGQADIAGADPMIAPTTAMAAGQEQFQVGWLCPVCGRNTVRSFYRSALLFQD